MKKDTYEVISKEEIVYFIHDRRICSGRILTSKVDTNTQVISYEIQVTQTSRITNINSGQVFESIALLKKEIDEQIKQITKV